MGKYIIIILALVVIGGGIYFYQSQNQNNSANTADQMMEDKTEDTMMEDKDKEDGEMMSDSGVYLAYSQAAYDSSAAKKRVLFFHATWCPTCKAANLEFEANLGKIPEDVVLLKTDYDTENALKQKYGITYQHTFVLVDSEGNELKKWSGGGITQLIANTL